MSGLTPEQKRSLLLIDADVSELVCTAFEAVMDRIETQEQAIQLGMVCMALGAGVLRTNGVDARGLLDDLVREGIDCGDRVRDVLAGRVDGT